MTDLPMHDRPTELTVVEPDDDLWPTRARRSGIRMRIPTALLVAGVSFWGGSTLQKAHGANASAAAAGVPAALRNAARARSTAGGFPGQTAGGSGGTSGTLTLLQGNMLWVTAGGRLARQTGFGGFPGGAGG